jgi:ankyrin repeat protein
VKLLLDKGADVNAQGGRYGNALQAASWGGHKATVKLLLDKGAEINAQGGYFGNALQAASFGGHEATVKLLLDEGADVNAQGGEFGNALQAASSKGHDAIIKLLLDKSVDVNAQGTGTDGRTALHLAAWGGHIDTFQYLVNLGLDLSALDAKGDGVLCYASSGGSLDVLQAALNHGLTLSSESLHWSALHWACRSGKPEVVELLIKEGLRGESVAITQPQGRWSPLDIAIFHGHKKMLKKLSSSCRDLLGSESDTTRSPGKQNGGYWCNGCFHVSVEPELLSLFDMKAGHLRASISLLHLPRSRLLFYVQAILRQPSYKSRVGGCRI